MQKANLQIAISQERALFNGRGPYFAYVADLWAESFVYRGYVTCYVCTL